MVTSWGRAHHFAHTLKQPGYLQDVRLAQNDPAGMTVHGQGRSYGDVALNDGGHVVATPQLNRVQRIDWERGVLRAESGVTLDQILRLAIPKGWFLPVTPGSKFVSLGGAVANDVHGKNHHHSGSFGAYVRALGLYRSNGERLTLSPDQNSDMFALTISGLGLTGFIEWVEIQLIPIRSSLMDVENIPYLDLNAFYDLTTESHDWPYTVAWIDCFSKGHSLGRGVFTRARHSAQPGPLTPHNLDTKITWPLQTPSWVLNKATISAFNNLYRLRPGARFVGTQSYNSFFYPLDGIANWNRLYGRRGFFQHQCIIPPDQAKNAMRSLLDIIGSSGQGSFLAVMKCHGPETSPGRNSFCQEGTSLALDFANRGDQTRQLLRQLDAVVTQYNGRLYPAKDGTMSAQMFQVGYPNWRALETARDPAFTSAFWQRVTGDS